ncbi:hypothetical protein CNR22_07825 [Sphingobacteriaceae bacterium]|nr:hypothetical protein CNR22_07825 [Sphingobacteriaceae bacterium]
MKKISALLLWLCIFKMNAQLPAYVPTVGLTGFWVFNGNANDVSGNGNHGTVNGASQTSDRFSSANTAYNFNGSSDYISTNYAGILGTNARAVSFWARTTDSIAGMTAVAWGDNQFNPNAGKRFDCGFNYQVAGVTIGGADCAMTYEGHNYEFDDVWHHYIFQCNTTTLSSVEIYQDGVLLTTVLHSFMPATVLSTVNNFNVHFGKIVYTPAPSFFHGGLDDIGIWDRTLTPCEIQQLYTSSGNSSGTLSAISSMSTICSGSSATLTANGIGPYTWNPGGATTASVVVNPSSTTIYTVSSPCASQATVALIVSPTPTMGASINPPSICAGSQATLTATGAITYTWVGFGSTASVVISPTAQTTYTVYGSNGACSSTLIRVQNVLPTPTLFISSSDTTICGGSTVTISANGANSYTWLPGGTQGPNITVSPVVTTIYTVTGSNSSGCTSSETWTIFLGTTQPLLASVTPTILCPGTTCTLSASGANTYTWLPLNSTGASVTDNPAASTTYTVLGESGSCLSSATVAVKVGFDITLSASGNLCNNTSVDLTYSPASPANTVSWTGPGISGSSNSPIQNVTLPGIYSVVVTNTNTGCTATASIAITSVLSPLDFSITPSSTLTCFPGPPVTLLVSSSANYNWLPAAEVSPNSGPLVSVSPSITTTYIAVAQLGACTGTAAVTISVNITPTVTAVSSSATLCAGKSLTLTANGATEYFWLPGDLSGPSLTVSPFATTAYTVTGANGNCTSSFTVPVTVFPSPQLLTTASPATICLGFSSTLAVVGAPVLTWLTLNNPAPSNTINVSPLTSVTYSAIGTNSFGCSSIATVQVNVIQSPVLTATSSSSEICAGESITLTASGSSNYTWTPGNEFAPSIVVSPTSSVTYTVVSDNPACSNASVNVIVNLCVNLSLGITNAAETPEQFSGEFYRIRFIVTAGNSSSSDLINVNLTNDLTATFNSPVSYTVIDAPTLLSKNSLLTVNSLFNGSSETNLVSPSASTLSANKRDTIGFTVLVRPNGFSGILRSSVLGFATDKINLITRDSSNNGFAWDPDNDGDPTNNNMPTPIELEPIEFFIPEGFSPDDDGRNDLFVIKGLNGRTAKLTIFNRWGTKVFTKEGSELIWDGKANVNAWGHDKLPPSTYYYIFEFSERRSKILTGFIVVKY